MAESIEYQVLLDVQSTLQGISVAGGYHFDVDADAVSLDPQDHMEIMRPTSGLTPFFVIEVSPNRTIEYFQADQIREIVPIDITCAASTEQTDRLDRIRVFERLCKDVETALAVDVTRGGLVGHHQIENKQMGIMVGSDRVFAIVETTVRLHRTYGAP